MNIRTWVLAAACVVVWDSSAAQGNAAGTSAPSEIQAPTAPRKSQTATIEEVMATDEDGYRARSYVVRWHGVRVLVTDPLSRTNLNIGDSISFIAARHEVAGQRILSFVLDGRQACRCDDKSPKPSVPVVETASAEMKTGLVEEVLSAEQDGYRFVAYIVLSHGSRLAVADPIARTHSAVGDSISFMANRIKINGAGLASFMIMPVGAGSERQPDSAAAPAAPTPTQTPTTTQTPDATRAPSAMQTPSAPSSSTQTGVIEEILTTSVEGYGYTAYVVRSLGSRVVVDDTADAKSHSVGDEVSLVVSRLSVALGQGALTIALKTASESGDVPAAMQMTMTNDTATVEEILTTETNGYRFMAYIVKWNGARVAISDVFATTHYAVGDRITFPVARSESAGRRQLRFMLFNFPKPASSPKKDDTPISTNSAT
jgi:hypothetical protein